MDGVMLIHNVDCPPLEGELDVYGAAAVVGGQHARRLLSGVEITSIRVM